MNEDKLIDAAQEMLDDLMVKLKDYRIGAGHESLRFFERVLNDNGFRNVSINIDSASSLKPVVTHAEEYKSLFTPVKGGL